MGTVARSSITWFLFSFVLYAYTSARGPMWADSSKLTIYAMHSYFPSLNPGDHAGWTVMAKLWLLLTSWTGPVRSLHLFSAFCGAMSVGLGYAYATLRYRDSRRGHSTAAVLVASLPLWWASTLTETYAMAAALMFAVAILSTCSEKPAWVALAGILSGLAAAVHCFTLFITIPLVASLPRTRWAHMIGGAVLGAMPVWLAAFGVPSDPLTGFHAGGGSSWSWHIAWFLEPSRALKGTLIMIALIAIALGPFGTRGIIAAIRSGAGSAHPQPWIGILALAALLGTLSGYAPFRLHLMVGIVIIGVLVLMAPVFSRLETASHVVVQVLIYTCLPLAIHYAGHDDLGIRELPSRNNAWYFLSPIKSSDGGPEAYARSLLQQARPEAVVLADFNPGALLRLVQETDRLRPDLTVVPTAIDGTMHSADPAEALAALIRVVHAQGRPVVLADSWEPYYHVTELHGRFGFGFRPCGPGITVVECPTRSAEDAPRLRKPVRGVTGVQDR